MQNLTRRVRDLAREPLELQDRPQPDQGHVHDLNGGRQAAFEYGGRGCGDRVAEKDGW